MGEGRSVVSIPENPADLVPYISPSPCPSLPPCPSPSLRPILKPSTAPILVREEDGPEEREVPEVFEDPCNQTVVEKGNVTEQTEEVEEEPPKRVSKFKAMRAAKFQQ